MIQEVEKKKSKNMTSQVLKVYRYYPRILSWIFQSFFLLTQQQCYHVIWQEQSDL